jgi:pyruvate ferredoxin oxidoreductase delta subunit
MSKLKGWKEVPRGGMIIEAGSAEEYETGSWRTFRPRWHEDNCIQCLRCWIYCPDSAIILKDGNVVGMDYVHCKGCGICAQECPAKEKAITMERETHAEK